MQLLQRQFATTFPAPTVASLLICSLQLNFELSSIFLPASLSLSVLALSPVGTICAAYFALCRHMLPASATATAACLCCLCISVTHKICELNLYLKFRLVAVSSFQLLFQFLFVAAAASANCRPSCITSQNILYVQICA